jgi:very-short-patch-repair endonuclease
LKKNDTLLARAKTFRTHQTPPEQALWKLLRAHRLSGMKFTRQVPVGPYIVDFAARAIKLAIELDGDTHASQVAYDAARTDYLQAQGYRVIRFTNADVMGNAPGVLEAILAALASPPLPGPLPDGEREQEHPAQPAPSPPRGEGWGQERSRTPRLKDKP